jgi:hypothetical protein
MAGTPFVVSAAGPRILQLGIGLTQPGSDYQAALETWDLAPEGQSGANLFRVIQVAGKCTNGFALGVTPVVDGEALPEQTFHGAGTGEFHVDAFFSERGTRLEAMLRTLSRTGEIEIHDIAGGVVPLRSVP